MPLSSAALITRSPFWATTALPLIVRWTSFGLGGGTSASAAPDVGTASVGLVSLIVQPPAAVCGRATRCCAPRRATRCRAPQRRARSFARLARSSVPSRCARGDDRDRHPPRRRAGHLRGELLREQRERGVD